MEILKELVENMLTLKLKGRMDTTTAPSLEAIVNNELGGVDKLVMDFKELEYVSSAGLRVLLTAQKIMGSRGGMELLNVNSGIMDVFNMTGFSDILTIK